MKFRKKPVVVEAWQWDGGSPTEERALLALADEAEASADAAARGGE